MRLRRLVRLVSMYVQGRFRRLGMVLVESTVNLMSEARLASEARGASAVRLVSKALMASRGAFGV